MENLYNHIDDDGNSYSLLKGNTDYDVTINVAIAKKGHFVNSHGSKRKVITTKMFCMPLTIGVKMKRVKRIIFEIERRIG